MKSYCSFRFVQTCLLKESISKTAEILLLWCALTTSVCILIASCWAWQLADMGLNSDGKKPYDTADPVYMYVCVCVRQHSICVYMHIIAYKYMLHAYMYSFMCLRKKFHFSASTEFENSFDLQPLSSKSFCLLSVSVLIIDGRQLIWRLKW